MLHKHLGLKGCELILFAIIWSYTISGKALFASESNLAEDLGYTREHIGKTLRALRKKGLISRSSKKHSKLPTYDYIVNIDGVCSAFPPMKDILKDEKKAHNMMGANFSRGSDIFSHNKSTNICIFDKGGDEDVPLSAPDNPLPTLEEIRTYASETKSLIDPEEFYETCCRKNWVIGGRIVNDWTRLFDHWKPKQQTKVEAQKERPTTTAQSVTDKYESLFRSIGYEID